MFQRQSKATIESLIGASTQINGNVSFKGGLRIDGKINGNVMAEEGSHSILIISEHAVIDGEVKADHLVVNGQINGPVFSNELIELQAKARINGDVQYKALEMVNGAIVDGKLMHIEAAEPVLKLAASNANS